MKISLILSSILIFSPFAMCAQKFEWKEALAYQLSHMPLKCIQQEYPNKTGHIIMDENDALKSPSQLHPSFYGCLDWHSSVHGHWMLVKILKDYPNISNKDSILTVLENSFNADKILAERQYFEAYPLAKTFERTYGWAWLLKLDEELHTWDAPIAQKWSKNLRPLTDKILELWMAYLPKQTYANHTGVHPNSAFGLAFAWDWAVATHHDEFKNMIEDKIASFYLDLHNYKAQLEPDGSDFFSNSLYIAECMTRILDKEAYQRWFDNFLSMQDIQHLCQTPVVSDRMDYLITHLDGLMFTRAWNLLNISQHLSYQHPARDLMINHAHQLIDTAVDNLDKGNYGGEHWLASFAVYALTR